MTLYERQIQLERRQTIGTGLAIVGITVGFLAFCSTIGPTNIDVVVDERGSDVTEDRPLARDIEVVYQTTPATVEVVKERHEPNPYLEEDLEVLAHLIYAEAGDNTDLAWAVGSVVLNRVESDLYPDTVYEVIHQGNGSQYSPVKHNFMENEPTYETYYITTILLEQGSILPEDILGQSGYEIFKRHGKELYKRIGNDYFYTMK